MVNMLEAKTHLSRRVEAIETGAASEVVIARSRDHITKYINHFPINAYSFRISHVKMWASGQQFEKPLHRRSDN